MLELRNLSKKFGQQHVLKDVSLKIPKGQITIIIGPSGTGKSVLLKHIIGLVKPDAGQIFLDGVELTSLDLETMKNVRMRFGMLFQDAALFDSMSVYENVSFPLREHRDYPEEKIAEIVRQRLADINLVGAEKKCLPNCPAG